jgi:transcriptional regulator with XRE-family HTH domain
MTFIFKNNNTMNRKKTKQIRTDFKQLESRNAHLIDKQMEIGAQVARYIRELGITQKALAKKADIGESQLSDILSGEANPTLKTLVKIEAALERDIIVAPAFYEEDINQRGITHIPVKHAEQIQWDSANELFTEVSKQVTYNVGEDNITFEEFSESEFSEQENLLSLS